LSKPNLIELPGAEQIAILYEDRAVLVLDKPPGWLLAPDSWQQTNRNLQLALTAGIRAGDFWARSRNLKYLRFVHRLDAETSGVLLLAKSPGAVSIYSALFESRRMEKAYLAVVSGRPEKTEWVCRLRLAPDRANRGRMMVNPRHGKEAETRFRALELRPDSALFLVRPLTGRTHQIRVHLAASGHPVLGDKLYGKEARQSRVSRNLRSETRAENRNAMADGKRQIEKTLSGVGAPDLALRAIGLSYLDPFTHHRVRITAPVGEFLSRYGFGAESVQQAVEIWHRGQAQDRAA